MIIHDVEQNTPEWLALRVGIPTASEFHRLVTSTGAPSKQLSDYAAQLAAEKYAGRPLDRWNGNQWTERGHELEAEARAAYEFLSSRGVKPVGFVTNHGAGCSPDGMTDEDLIEIKCLSAKVHVQTLAYHARHQRCPPDYVQQARGQMWICDRKRVTLFFYHPDLPHLWVELKRDTDFDVALYEQVRSVIAERDHLVEILGAYA